MKLFNFDAKSTTIPRQEKILDDISCDNNTSDKLIKFEDDLATHKNKHSTEYDQIRRQILEEYINLNYSLAKITTFLEKHKLTIDYCNSIILRNICYKGNLKFVKLLMQEHKDLIKFDDFYQSTIRYAVQSGNLDLVNFLLDQPSVDPSHPLVLTMAVINNHPSIVRRLLQDKRVDPTAWDNHALEWAQELNKVNGDYHEIITLFMTHKK